MTSPRPALALSALLAVAGVTHFAYPKPYDRIVPTALPGSARTWTYVSGVAELAVAAAVAAPRTRKLGGLAAAALFTAVFPANIKMALDARGRSRGEQLATVARLPLQVPLVIWALRVSRSAA
ncbi:DoxX family protein [Kutzneria chonburiensis]|uniref:MauE/DoxX family redox-associated membrane protein n=1 Tax=Kutzneria chonburiensis TaxID=1483604 RepID=A0ABV6N4H8_9PSEU|nr:MauE/DoxX family redox-associated membrane protein [Kutzneria chonburiensis]